jgi:choline dehydrogenase
MSRVIICGGGSAGCVLAARLSEDPSVEVVLLEAGPDFPTVDELPEDVRNAWIFGVEDHDWGWVSDDHVEQIENPNTIFAPEAEAIHAWRGKVIGGSSSTNASNALRPPSQDFDRWVGLGNDRWSWDQVLPAFRAMEDDPIGGERHGSGGPVPVRRFTGDALRPIFADFIEAAGHAGYPVVDDLNGTDYGGAGPVPLNQVDQVRQSTNVAYLNPARGRPNLEIRGDVVVDRVELVDGRARAVVLASGERLDADLVVLSAGALASPGILMRSGVGPARLLERLGIEIVHALDGVGRTLRDHPMVYPTYALNEKAGPPAPPLQAALALSSTGPGGRGEIDLHFIPVTPADDQLIVSVGLVRPYSLGRYEIRSADPHEPPSILFNVLDHPEDLARIVRGVVLTRELLAREPLASYITEELWPGPDVRTEAELVAAVLGAKNTYAHATSTCSMGPADAPGAVVDQTGQVHGLENLYVVDASIFPTIPSVPTNLTTIMVAERCAAELRRQAVSSPPSTASVTPVM